MNPTPIDLFLRATFAGFSLILLLVSMFSVRRYGGVRLYLVTASFATISITAWLIMVSSFIGWAEFEMSAPVVLLQLVVLVLLYLAILKR